MERHSVIREALAYLCSVSGRYPYGIPRSVSARPRAEKLLHFVGAMNSAERAILDAAVTQGLKFSLSDISVSVMPERIEDGKTAAEWASEVLAANPAKIHVLLGEHFSLGGRAAKGELQFVDGRRVLVTENLNAVSHDAAAKRRFWSALKGIPALLAA